MCLLQGRGHSAQRIGVSSRGDDTLSSKPVIGGEGLEQADDGIEERDRLGTSGAAARQAGRLQGARRRRVGSEKNAACDDWTVPVARSVGAPFMFPELLVLAVDVDPVL